MKPKMKRKMPIARSAVMALMLVLALLLVAVTAVLAVDYATVSYHLDSDNTYNNAEYWEAQLGLEDPSYCTKNDAIGSLNVGDYLLPAAPVDYKYAAVIVKAGSGTNANTIFAEPNLASGQTVWADNDGDKVYDTNPPDISHIIFCYSFVYPLRAEKTAAGSYDRTVEWTLTKSVAPASHTGKAGEDAGSSTWTVVADKSETLDNYQVNGSITVYNDNNFAVPVTVGDVLDDGAVATVTCPTSQDNTATVPAYGSVKCSYSATPADAKATLNTATITSGDPDVQGATATAGVSFTENLIGDDLVTLTDPRVAFSEIIGGDTTETFPETFKCPADANLYENGTYSFTETNTAYLDGNNTDLEDSATVDVTCTLDALVPSKTAAGSYDRTVTWELDKYVNAKFTENVVYNGNPGDIFDTDWLLYVDKTEVSDNYKVTGTISINNPAAVTQYVTGVSDVLNDGDGTVATVDCGAQFPIEIAAGATLECSYTAVPADGSATLNTATVSAVGNADQQATAEVSFIENLIGVDSGTLTDDRFPLFSETVSGDAEFTLEEDFACSTDRADYGENGEYSYKITNEGKLVVNATLTDDASVTVNCEASFVDIYKTTNGQPADPTKDIAFALWSGTTQLEVVSTLNNGPDLSFQTALVPGDQYTICESPVPAGYTFEISVNGGNVLTYAGPPGEQNPTGEIQCFDFTAPDPDIQVVLTFNIENSFPGGAPRTPGYWKNWNTCSGGNQAVTADKLNGGFAPGEEGFQGVYLLDDLLPQTLGDYLTIATCEDGVSILDARDLTEVNKNGDPINRSSDAAYTLARALLAARLNQDAGACTADGYDFLGEYGFDGTFEQLLTAADDVLSDPLVQFTGTGSYLSPQDLKGKNNPLVPLAEQALYLHEIIDDYNNGFICTGEPSH